MDQATRHASAWLALTFALAVHVADEAAHDFLSVYNPTAAALRERLPWLPVPQFTFDLWFGGLLVFVSLLLLLTPLVRSESRVLLYVSLFLGVIMTCNGLGHVAGSVYLHRPMPGVYSSPLLLAASLWLLREAWRRFALFHASTHA